MARFYSEFYGMGVHPATRAGTLADGLYGYVSGEYSLHTQKAGKLMVEAFMRNGEEWCRIWMGVTTDYGNALNNWKRTTDTSKAHLLYEGPLGRNPISERMAQAFAYHQAEGF